MELGCEYRRKNEVGDNEWKTKMVYIGRIVHPAFIMGKYKCTLFIVSALILIFKSSSGLVKTGWNSARMS